MLIEDGCVTALHEQSMLPDRAICQSINGILPPGLFNIPVNGGGVVPNNGPS
ncbi:hypothetical protein SAMN04515695_0458 [Pseudovibrio sp. Tun.PSC04-5.I4]|nr:hypothetical protein SAMN04515695_0458 [Pseudovibrio sp. Tun.PSC04-5.I4]